MTDMLRVLIIYELAHTELKVYDLVMTKDQYAKAAKCHGHYINSADWPPECEWLAEFLDPYLPIYSDEPWHQSFPHAFEHKVDALVVTGILP